MGSSSTRAEQDRVNVENGLPVYGGSSNQNDQPPSYQSVIDKIKNAHKTSENKQDFAKNCYEIANDNIDCTIGNALLLALPVAMITVGAINIDNCPIERFVPIWLVVAGSTSAVLQLATIFDNIRDKCMKPQDSDKKGKMTACLKSYPGLLGCFSFAWFIAGNVWVYSIYAPETDDPRLPIYCDHATYYFAFWVITITYILLGLGMCGCTAMCCFLCKGVASVDTEPKEATGRENSTSLPLD